METTRTDVLIVGAGPTGLSLACQLIRYGVDFVILDQRETTTPHSKAVGVQARTLEIYEQIGLAEPLIAQGAVAVKGRMVVGGEVRGEIEFGELGKGLSPYPYVLIVEQGRHEKILHDFVKENGREVRWLTRLESFAQTDAGVSAVVKDADGAGETVEAKYLVGCDGAKSFVRHSLGLKFEGSTFERMFYVADVRLDWELSHDAVTIFLMRHNLLVFFPMTGEKQWRIVGTFPEEFAKDEGDVLYEEIESQIKRDAELELDITGVNWFSTYKVHSRRVERFSRGRCFLAGDAAHIHTPAGAQGMNTGIQDGYNLAWKMALALKGLAGEKLLDTYNEERLENAKNLLRTTDRMFQLAAGPEWLISFIRTNVFPAVAGYLFTLDTVKKFVFPLVSQIGINYRHGSLSLHEGDGDFKVMAGDRMPYFKVGGGSVYDGLRGPKCHLLAFTDEQGAVRTWDEETERRYADLVDFQTLPLGRQAAEAFGTGGPFEVLLRPDNYVGYISAGASSGGWKAYLEDLVGLTGR
jgi:2-polyprenyl-6-methoxyphenol hydroxylase-like FAD-dependent oxidoreductase